MGERKGTNKYYPPDFDPKIHRNLNAYHRTHALRERGRKANQGILTIRFEMPFNCWCLTCKNPIGMGVRYNAEKTKVGMYHSTPIYRFSMPCAICAGTIIIQTDPQNFDYVILEGARRKNQKWDAEENEQIVIADAAEKKKLATDAMYHLEHDVKDKTKVATVGPVLRQLEYDRETLKDDFALNQMARKQFREAKRLAMEESERDRAMAKRLSLLDSDVHILPEDESDRKMAKILRLSHMQTKDQIDKHRPGIEDDVLFQSVRKSSTTAASTSLSCDRSLVEPTESISSDSSLVASIPSVPSPHPATKFIRSEVLKRRSQAFTSLSSVPSSDGKSNSSDLGIRILRQPVIQSVDQSLLTQCTDLVSYEDTDDE